MARGKLVLVDDGLPSFVEPMGKYVFADGESIDLTKKQWDELLAKMALEMREEVKS